MAKFSRAVFVSCSVYIIADVTLISAPQFSMFVEYARVQELVRSLRTSLNARAK